MKHFALALTASVAIVSAVFAFGGRAHAQANGGGLGAANPACFNPGDANADAASAAGVPPCASPSVTGAGSLEQGAGALSATAGGAVTGGGQILPRSPANREAVSNVLQHLGLSADELSALKSETATGGLGPDEIQQLCLRLAAKQLSADDVPGITSALGLKLTDEQIAQLKSCTQLATEQKSGAQAGSTAGAARTRPDEVSSIEKTFRALDSGAAPEVPTAHEISQFGYALFSAKSSGAAAASDVPVGINYVIGPGDELKVLMWGRINDTLALTVSRDGAIAIPGIGPFEVAGLTFDQAKKLIEGRAGQITGVKVDVTMGRLRTIQVFVVGEVEQPGAYSVSALGHVSNALEAAGGITKIGSLRRIELRRGNQLAKVIDLYGLLLSGRLAGDDQLQAGDVIFVPVIGPVAGVVGDVKRPAIYELASQSDSLGNLIKVAGGISAFGYAQRVQVERVQNHQQRVALDIDLSDVRAARFEVRDGDLVKVYPVLPAQHDVVLVHGNVNRPGKYEWHPGMRVADLVAAAEGVAPHTFFRYALIRRKEGREKKLRILPVDLGQALSDHLAGPANPALEQEDELTVFNESQMKYLPTVQVLGEVRNPGYYVLTDGMRVSDLLYLAGGLRDDAYQKQAELARTQVVDGSHTSHTFMDIDLRAALEGAEQHNPALEANDQLFVRRATDWHLPWVVYVRGRVARPGPYTIHEGERIASVLERCGGLLSDAFLPAAVLIRQSVRQAEQERLDQARQRLEEAILRARLNPSPFAPTTGLAGGANGIAAAPGADAQSVAILERVLAESEGRQAQGRLVIHLKPLDELVSTPDNIAMVDQDALTIPRRPASINVLGEVYSPNSIVYRPGLTVRDYLNQAGGPNEGADPGHIMVIKADGSVLTDDGLRASREATMFPLLPVISGGLMSARAEPGDTIYVPEKLEYVSKLQMTATVTQVIAQTAGALAVVGILAAAL
ncbi:MAG TPA: SLBB domain-containing protein [Candidatus Binataceae bacterium]|nr:SLBB domain-containing protein [Candidatus Binataceae bacterium]